MTSLSDKPAALQAKKVGWMMRWKLPPWSRSPFTVPTSPRHWIISLTLLVITVQTFIAPILSGAVNWTSTPVFLTNAAVSLAAVDNRANYGGWNWYNYPFEGAFGLTRKPYLPYLCTAAGYASMV